MIQLREGVEIVQGDEGHVALDSNRGVYWHLNSEVFDLITRLQGGESLETCIDGIVQRTGVEPARVRRDYMSALKALRKSKLIRGNLK